MANAGLNETTGFIQGIKNKRLAKLIGQLLYYKIVIR